MVSTVSVILPFTPLMNVSRINCGRDYISLNIVFSDRSKLRGDVVIRNKLHDMGPQSIARDSTKSLLGLILVVVLTHDITIRLAKKVESLKAGTLNS